MRIDEGKGKNHRQISQSAEYQGTKGRDTKARDTKNRSAKAQGMKGQGAKIRDIHSQSAGSQVRKAADQKSSAPVRLGDGRSSKNPVRKTANTGRVCPVSDRCGGCQWIDKSYEEQLQAKGTAFRRLMEPFGKPEHIIAMEHPFHYRNKVNAAFGEERGRNVVSGIYEEKSHCIVPVDSCLIENEKADEIIVSIRGLLKSFKIRPYNEDSGFGLLRHVMVRTGHATGQIMVVLVLSSPVLPSKHNFVKALLALHPQITTIVISVNDQDTSMVLGNREEVIYGKGYIEDELCGRIFRISPRSFYQVNPVQTQKLYAKAMEYAALTGTETVLDAYCGTGTIGMIASSQAAKVIGVELNQDAVRDAINNARRNQITNIYFYRNDAGDFLQDMAQQGEKVDVLFMDPPRSGSSEAFLTAIGKLKPDRVVYISCSPETLVRDLRILSKQRYRVEKSVAVDMFPYTDSLECVCLLSSRKPDTKVRRS